MKRKIKRYKVSPDESFCLAVSVVDKPAVESDFQFFSEQRMEKFVGVEGERKMIYGCALRPDFPIYRNDGKEEYYLEFDKDAIDKISKNYFKMGFQANWTAGHKDEVEGLTITESWIKESMTLDKSVALGLDPELPVGSWIIGCHCENDEIWNAVKQGTYHGFSVEAVVGVEEFEKQVEELNSKIDNNMNIETSEMFWEKLKNILKETFSKKEDESVEQHTIEPTNIELEENSPAPEPVSEPHEAPKVEEPVVEPEPAPEPVEPKNEPVNVEEPKPAEPNPLEELVRNLTEELKALKTANEGLQEKIAEMGKKPSAEPVNVNAKPNAGDTYAAWRDQMRKMIG